MEESHFLHGPCVVLLTTLLVTFFSTSQSVPPEYCLHSLNTSDCNGPPTAVAYYYKSGSRCEIAIWRGCPTLNKFSDEVICSHFCIGKIIRSGSEEKHFENQATVTQTPICPFYNISTEEFEAWVRELQLEEVKFIDTILENINDDLNYQEIQIRSEITTEEVTTTVAAEEETTTVAAEEETTTNEAPVIE